MCISEGYFYNLNNIFIDKNVYVEQNENILKIKFNTTTYNAKLEYFIALIDYIDDINPISFHNIIFGNNFIFKNIFNSKGIDL